MTRANARIITAVSYSDVFDFPLTDAEVREWSNISPNSRIPAIRGIARYRGYVVISGRERITAVRDRRERVASGKWARALSAGAILGRVPTVMLVGITGGLSVNNTEKSDDIDMLIVARRGTLWATRLIVTIVADALKLRRRPDSTDVSDMVCLNMFMADDELALPVSEQDLFSAHEVIQMKPVFDRSGTYSRFLKANSWAGRFAPGIWTRLVRTAKTPASHKPSVPALICSLIEPAARMGQLWYMNRRRTSEVIRRGQIRFHPRDARAWVRNKLAKRLKNWRIPLDKIFYAP